MFLGCLGPLTSMVRSKIAFGPSNFWAWPFFNSAPIEFLWFCQVIQKFQIAHAIYESWVIFHKELHGDNDLFIWPLFKIHMVQLMKTCSVHLIQDFNSKLSLDSNLIGISFPFQSEAYYICFWGALAHWPAWWGQKLHLAPLTFMAIEYEGSWLSSQMAEVIANFKW